MKKLGSLFTILVILFTFGCGGRGSQSAASIASEGALSGGSQSAASVASEGASGVQGGSTPGGVGSPGYISEEEAAEAFGDTDVWNR